MNSLFRGFFIKEFLQALRDPRMAAMLFVAPILQLTLFGYALTTETRNIRVALYQAPQDDTMRELRRHLLASGWFIFVEPKLGDTPYSMIEKGKVDVSVVAPEKGLNRALARGEGRLQVLINSSNLVRAQSIEQYLTQVLQKLKAAKFPNSGSDFASDTGAMALPGAELLPASFRRQPVNFDLRLLYNPTLESSAFMVPGVMSMIICLVTILLTSMALAKEKELGTFEMLIAAPVFPYEIIIGKTVPFIVLGLTNLPLILGTAMLLFAVPFKGSMMLLLFAALLFMMATVGVGLLISTFAATQQQAMMGSFIFLFTALMLSGMFFPIETMPLGIRAISYMSPLTYFIDIIRNISLKGGNTILILKECAALGVIDVVILFISIKRFRTSL